MLKKISVFTAEDDPVDKLLVRKFLQEIKEFDIVGEASNGDEAIAKIQKLKPDLLILDIHMPEKTGIEVCNEIIAKDYSPHIIFITSHENYAVHGFDLGAIDFITKPCNKTRFHKAIDRFLAAWDSKLLNRYNTIRNPGLSIKDGDEKIIIPYRDIVYITGSKRTCVLHCKNKDYEIPMLLKELDATLQNDTFCRISKTFVVNISFVENLKYNQSGTYNLVLQDDIDILKVGVSYVKDLKKKLELLEL